MALPGDGVVPGATAQQTRAIGIDAPAERVWPWLAQIGQDRAGFYSYDVLENLVADFDLTLGLCGCASPGELGREHLLEAPLGPSALGP